MRGRWVSLPLIILLLFSCDAFSGIRDEAPEYSFLIDLGLDKTEIPLLSGAALYLATHLS